MGCLGVGSAHSDSELPEPSRIVVSGLIAAARDSQIHECFVTVVWGGFRLRRRAVTGRVPPCRQRQLLRPGVGYPYRFDVCFGVCAGFESNRPSAQPPTFAPTEVPKPGPMMAVPTAAPAMLAPVG